MMRSIRYTGQFVKDARLMQKRGMDLVKLGKAVEYLESGQLPAEYCDHDLAGNFTRKRLCSVQPDWLLVYSIVGNDLILGRTGIRDDLLRLP